MATRAVFTKQVLGFGPILTSQVTRSANNGSQVVVPVAKGKGSTNWVKASANTGTVTLAAGHGYTTGTYDIYWSGGSRRNVSVTVATNTLTLSSGTGTNYPATSSTAGAVIVSAQVGFSVGIGDMSAVKIISRQMNYFSTTATTKNAILQLLDVGHSFATYLDLEPNASVIHDIEGGEETDLIEDSYLTGIISNPSTLKDASFRMMWLVD